MSVELTDRAAVFAAAARRYGGLGWALIRLDGKVPKGSRWQETRPDPDPEHAAGLWATWGEHWNVGVVLGTSGLAVVEYDSDEGRTKLNELLGGELPETPTVITGSGRLHLYFEPPADAAKAARDGIELRLGPHQCVLPPSEHPDTGRPYSWVEGREPWTLPLAELPAAVLDYLAEARPNGRARAVGELIPSGQRNATLASLAGTLRRRGLDVEEITAALAAVNERRCEVPLAADELREIAASVGRYPAAVPLIEPAPPEPPAAVGDVGEVVETFRRWLYLPDPGALLVTLAAVVANRVPGDPVWLLLCGPSSCGKTEILAALGGLPEITPAATLTEAGLLSGVPRKEVVTGASGGLLRAIGDYGILALKDFGSILSQHSDTRAATLAALREVYDGSWTRTLGTDGGRALTWQGKLGLVAGVTTVVDRHHGVIDSLGSRFAFYRVEVPDRVQQVRRALANRHRMAGMRDELREVVAGFLDGLDLPDGRDEPTEADELRIGELADFVTLARSPIERDRSTREVELVPDAEAPARFGVALASLLDGLRLLGLDDERCWALVSKVALDSMPATRRRLLLYLAEVVETTTKAAATGIGLPTTTTRRALEDLAAHGLIERSGDEGKADVWRLVFHAGLIVPAKPPPV